MAVFNGAFPVLPGKVEQARNLAREVAGPRSKEFRESQARAGITHETWSIQSTPNGDFVLVWFEVPDVEKSFAVLAESSDSFDVWFRNQVKDISGVDLAAPAEEPPPDLVLDWKA